MEPRNRDPMEPRNREERRPLLDFPEAERYSGISLRYLRRLRAERRLAVVKIGRRVFVDPGDLDTLIEAGGREPAIWDAQ